MERASPFEAPSGTEARLGRLAALLVLGPLAGLLLSWVPLPGLDGGVSEAYGYRREFSLLGSPSVALLVVMRWLLAVRPDLRSLWALLLVAGSATVGVMQGLSLYELDVPLVIDPSISFLVLASLTVTATAAALWWLGDLIDTHVPLASAPALWWCFGPAQVVPMQFSHGESLMVDLRALLWLFDPLIWLLPLLWVSVRPRRWPLPLAGALQLRSGLEAVLTVWTAGALVLQLFLPSAYELALHGLVTVALLAVFDRETEPGSLSMWAWAATALSVSALAGLWVLGFLSGGGLRLLQPGPYAGEGSFTLELGSASARANDDAEALERRLEALQVDATVTVAGEHLLHVQLDGVSEPMAPMAAALTGASLTVSGLAPGDPQVHRAPSADALRQLPVPEGARLVIGCPEPDQCVAYLVGEPVLDGSDVEYAAVGFNEQQQEPYLSITLDEDGAARFGEATTRLVGQLLVVDVEGELLVAPSVREPILGGQVNIEAGGQEDPLAWCREMAAALTNPLSGPWQILAVR